MSEGEYFICGGSLHQRLSAGPAVTPTSDTIRCTGAPKFITAISFSVHRSTGPPVHRSTDLPANDSLDQVGDAATGLRNRIVVARRYDVSVRVDGDLSRRRTRVHLARFHWFRSELEPLLRAHGAPLCRELTGLRVHDASDHSSGNREVHTAWLSPASLV